MKQLLKLPICIVVSISAASAVADTVELRNGSIVNGTYMGGTATSIRLETPQGVQVVPTADILAITFSGSKAPATTGPAAPAVAAPTPVAPAPVAPAPAAAPVAVTLPAGLVLTIRMVSQVSSQDPTGRKFTATLLADLRSGDVVVVKAGTTVYGQVEQSKQAGRLAGKSQLAISLTGIDKAGVILPIMTTNFAEAGKGEFRKTARNTAGGALIGNAIDDDGGAGTGAAVGAGVSLIKKGDAVTIPPGAILEFRLTQAVQTTSL